MPDMKFAAALSQSFGGSAAKTIPGDTEVYVGGMKVGHARNAVVQDKAAMGSAPAGTRPIAHEAAQMVQQAGGGAIGGTELTLTFEKIEWTYAEKGMSPEIAMRARTGQPVQIKSGGRVVAEGRLKGAGRSLAGDHKEWIDILMPPPPPLPTPPPSQ